MSFEIAQKIILQEFDFLHNNQEYDSIEFCLMGGEPLMAFPLICEIVNWVHQLKTDVPFIFLVVTNGTLLDLNKRQWLEKNKDKIVLGLSVDGLSDMHRVNRGCYLEQLPVSWAHNLWPDQQFKMTISKETIRDFAKGVLFLQSKKLIVQTTLALGVEWSVCDAEEYAYQLGTLSAFYLSHREVKPLSILTKNIEPLFYECSLREKCCSSGTRSVTYDINGDRYPCVVFTPLVFGKNILKEISEINFNNNNIFFDNECTDCFIRNMCKTCYGLNLKFRGCVATRDKSACKMYKEEILAICKFQRDVILAKSGSLTEKENERVLMAIKVINILCEK